jgi:hypothetical protein
MRLLEGEDFIDRYLESPAVKADVGKPPQRTRPMGLLSISPKVLSGPA